MDQKLSKQSGSLYKWVFESAADRVFPRNFESAEVGSIAKQSDNGTLWMLTAVADIVVPAVLDDEEEVLVAAYVHPEKKTPTWTQVGGPSLSPNGSAFTIGVDNSGNVNTTSI